MTEGHYVYAILARETSVPPGLTGIRGTALQMVAHRELRAATSAVEAIALPATVDDALTHETVVEALRQAGPALPVRFGTILADTPAVVRALAERYETLVADLVRLADTVEYGLSVLWEQLEPERTAHETAPSQSAEDPGDVSSNPGSRYLHARLAEHRRDTLRRANAEQTARDLDALLRPFALDSRWTIRPASRIAARAAYLLHQSAVEPFRQAFEEGRVLNPDLRFLLSGPWPPYSFVTAPAPGGAPIAGSGTTE